MPSCHRLLALLLVSRMVPVAPVRAASALAIVTSASSARLGDAGLSAGTTLYDGDRFSTDTNGELAIRGKTFKAQFGSRSAVLLQDRPSELENGTVIEMYAGRMDLSTTATASVSIHAEGAIFRPVQNNVALATIEIRGPREVHIYVRRGAYNLEYREQTALLEEAKSYAILLDPTFQEIAFAEKLDPDVQRKKPSTTNRTFLVVLIAAAAAGVAIPELRHHMESPHKPGRGPH